MTSIKSTALFASPVLLLAAGIAIACSWIDEDAMSFSFFAPEVSRADGDRPFFRTFHTLYGVAMKDDNIADFDSINVKEWSAHFGGVVSDSDLAFLITRATIPQVDTLIRLARGSAVAGAASLRENSVLRLPAARTATDFLFYLGYAKRCAPFVTFVPGWDWTSRKAAPDPRRDTKAIAALIAAGQRAEARARSAFVRTRYRFQVLRLQFHGRMHEACVGSYTRHLADFDAGGSLRWRAMGYAAGSLLRLGRQPEADLLYARIFDQCATMRISAYLSYRPLDEPLLRAALARAESPRERALLWQLNGLYGDPLRSMKEIAAIDPASDLLALLLVRAVAIEEERVMPERWQGDPSVPADYRFKRAAVDTALQRFVQRAAALRSSAKPYLWDLAAGYLLLLGGRNADAASHLARARDGASSDALVLEQVRSIELLRRIDLLDMPTAEFEAYAAVELRWLRDNGHDPVLRGGTVLDYARKRMSLLYASAGDSVRAACLFDEGFPNFYLSPRLRAAMLTFMDHPRKSPFDRLLLDFHRYSRSDIIEYQAVALLYEDRLAEAVAMFESFTGSGDAGLPGDPFVIHINDCHDCDHADPARVRYTKLDFAKRMRDLKERVARDPKNASVNAFALANGYYNMTFFGNARRVYETEIGRREYVSISEAERWRGDPVFACGRAEQAYLVAMRASSDPEFRARCVFMAAKCEQNAFFLYKPAGYVGDFRAGKYFRALISEYASTDFTREALRECGYFRTFAGTR
ncbi:MAG: hypothetical protein IPP94_03505 [Ignavibacteria bacterium]|nr:hypothetical protein [Ignavibacteria bacterium]